MHYLLEKQNLLENLDIFVLKYVKSEINYP